MGPGLPAKARVQEGVKVHAEKAAAKANGKVKAKAKAKANGKVKARARAKDRARAKVPDVGRINKFVLLISKRREFCYARF